MSINDNVTGAHLPVRPGGTPQPSLGVLGLGVRQKAFFAVSELHAPISPNVPAVHAVMNGFQRTLNWVTHALCVRDPVQERR